jgi:hypothetical protein
MHLQFLAGITFNDFMAYKPSNMTWANITLPAPTRAYLGLSSSEGKIYAYGGMMKGTVPHVYRHSCYRSQRKQGNGQTKLAGVIYCLKHRIVLQIKSLKAIALLSY